MTGRAGVGVTERLPRLLSLVPYLIARPGVPIAEAAADFGVDEAQLRRDLELLWMCGLPGYGPGDLVDLSFEGDAVTVAFDAGMRRPLRLSGAEAATLAVALRALADAPGVADADAVQRALAKIEDASGRASAAADRAGDAPTAAEEAVVAVGRGRVAGRAEEAVRRAVETGRALRLTYYSASRDAVGRRVVDPMRLLMVDGATYLEAWCRRAEGVRLFRLDRVDDAAVLTEPAAPPPQARPRAGEGEEVLRPVEEAGVAALVLTPAARWVAEYYPTEPVDVGENGSARVTMRYGDRDWMVRLLLGLGDAVEVLGPEDLVAALDTRAREALGAYGDLFVNPVPRSSE